MLFALPQLPRTLPAALRDVSDASPQVRRSAVKDLTPHHPTDASVVEAALLAALEDDDPAVRGEAAEQLGACCVEAALPQLLTAVEDPHVVVRQMAIAALGDIGDGRALARLARAQRDPRPELRYQAIMALPRIAPQDAEEYFLHALADEDDDVRHIALRVAEETYLPRDLPADQRPALPAAVAARAVELLEDGAPRVRLAAALFLGEQGDHAGADILLEVVSGTAGGIDPDDEGAAVEAVGALALRSALPGLRSRAFGAGRFLKERFSFLALVSLARLGDATAREKILGDLRAWSKERRTLAVVAAGRGRLTVAVPVLQSIRDDGSVEASVVDEALALLVATR